jgi:predicted transcriptional regulator
MEKIELLNNLLKEVNANLCEAQERYKKSSDTDSLLMNSRGYNKGRMDAYNAVLNILHRKYAEELKHATNTE